MSMLNFIPPSRAITSAIKMDRWQEGWRKEEVKEVEKGGGKGGRRQCLEALKVLCWVERLSVSWDDARRGLADSQTCVFFFFFLSLSLITIDIQTKGQACEMSQHFPSLPRLGKKKEERGVVAWREIKEQPAPRSIFKLYATLFVMHLNCMCDESVSLTGMRQDVNNLC